MCEGSLVFCARARIVFCGRISLKGKSGERLLCPLPPPPSSLPAGSQWRERGREKSIFYANIFYTIFFKIIFNLPLPPACRPDHNGEREGVDKKRKVHFLHKHFLHKHFLQKYFFFLLIFIHFVTNYTCFSHTFVHGATHISDIIAFLIETNAQYMAFHTVFLAFWI